MTARYEKGMQTRRTVLGDAHVNRAEANKTQFDAPFQTLITEGAWGSDPTLAARPTKIRSGPEADLPTRPALGCKPQIVTLT